MIKNKAILSIEDLNTIQHMLEMFKEKFSISHIVFEEESIILRTLDSNVNYELMYVDYAMENDIKYLYLDESTDRVLVRVTK